MEYDISAAQTNADALVGEENIPSAEEFALHIQRLYRRAEEFGGNQHPDRLVLDYLRHEEYDSFQWKMLVGDINDDFISFVKKDDRLGLLRTFRDPVFPLGVKTSHLAAACVGVYQHGRPAGTGTNRGDITGWAGDWITFYADWRRDHERYSSAYAYCEAALMKLRVDSTFMLTDLVEDAYAYIIGMRLRNGESISDVVGNLFVGTVRVPALKAFFQGRFGDQVTAHNAALDALMPGDDELVDAGRLYLVQAVGGIPTLMPHRLPRERLDQFCRGFTTVLLDLIHEERELIGGPSS